MGRQLFNFTSYIAAMGGELSLVVEFKDRSPVKIAGLTSILHERDLDDREINSARPR
jgi:hypothetical protein